MSKIDKGREDYQRHGKTNADRKQFRQASEEKYKAHSESQIRRILG